MSQERLRQFNARARQLLREWSDAASRAVGLSGDVELSEPNASAGSASSTGKTGDAFDEETLVEGGGSSDARGLHSMLRYDAYDPEKGLFYNDDSVAFCFEVVAQTGADEDMVARLNTIFTPIPPHHGVQWCLFGSPLFDDALEAYLDERHVAYERGQTTPFFLDLAKRRVEHINRRSGTTFWQGQNFTIKNIRLMFSVTRTGRPDNSKLVEEMAELREVLQSSLRTAGLPAFSVDADAFIRFVWPILNPESMFADLAEGSALPDSWSPSKGHVTELTYDDGKPIKEQLTSFGQYVSVQTDGLLFGAPGAREGLGFVGGRADTDRAAHTLAERRVAVRGFSVLQYPKKKELWEMANIVGAFFDDGLQYPCPFLVSGGIFTLDPAVVDTNAQMKGMRAKQNAKSRMAEFQPTLELAARDWDVVLHQLDGGGNMCEIYHTLLLFAPKADINKVSQIALNIWRSERFSIVPLQMLHLCALYASLPMTLTKDARDDLKTLRILSTKTTINAVDMAPVIAEWKGTGDPVMMFFGRRGTPTFLDFYSNQQGNYNVFVCGVSGSGKSVVMNEIVSAYRGIGARVWVIDIGRSYRNLVALQKGTFIEFSPDTRICINPFSWIGTDSELDFKAEMRMLKPTIGRMASPDAPLTSFQYALIEEAIQAVWNDYGQDTNPTRIRDYLLEKIKNEAGGTERMAYELGKQLLPFTEEGVYGAFFNGRANISFDDDMVALELDDLKNAPGLRRVVLFTLTSRIAHDMYLSRHRKKLCLIDEGWQMFGEDQESADFIEEGNRRARKYDGMFCMGTQGIEDAYKNPASQAAYNNADWKIFLRQDRKNLEKLIHDGTVNFSGAVKRMLLSLRTEKGRFSEMLISSPNGDAVVRHIPDPFSLMMASTNAADFNECNDLLAQGYSTMDALEIMVARRSSNGA